MGCKNIMRIKFKVSKINIKKFDKKFKIVYKKIKNK